MNFQQNFAAEALALVGVPFRLRGREVATGVDCVGLIILAARRAGRSVPEVPAYGLRGTTAAKATQALMAHGLLPADSAGEGTILLAEGGPMQLHLMVQTVNGIVHAHAGLGRVVLTPGPSSSPILSVWRFPYRNNQE